MRRASRGHLGTSKTFWNVQFTHIGLASENLPSSSCRPSLKSPVSPELAVVFRWEGRACSEMLILLKYVDLVSDI